MNNIQYLKIKIKKIFFSMQKCIGNIHRTQKNKKHSQNEIKQNAQKKQIPKPNRTRKKQRKRMKNKTKNILNNKIYTMMSDNDPSSSSSLTSSSFSSSSSSSSSFSFLNKKQKKI